MSFTTLQTNKICRTCLSEDNIMRSIFSIDETIGGSTRFHEMLMTFASVQVMLSICLLKYESIDTVLDPGR